VKGALRFLRFRLTFFSSTALSYSVAVIRAMNDIETCSTPMVDSAFFLFVTILSRL
jgi:hypothetical protein